MIFHNIYALPLKTVIALMIIILIVWTIIGIILTNHRKAWRVVNATSTIISLTAILYLTLINRSEQEPQISFIRTIEHVKAQPELLREMVMNAFLFFPLGLTAPYAMESLPYVKDKKSRQVVITVLIALILSCSIELIQHLNQIGNAELSDIIMNTLGTAIGSVSYIISTKLRKTR